LKVARRRIRASTVATITAVAAIALGIVDSYQTRAHNRLSVAPYLVVDYTMSARPGESSYTVSVSNEGVGPAVIESLEITLPASLGGGKYENWNEAVPLLRQRGARVPSYWNYSGGEALGVQRSRDLIQVTVGSDRAEQLMPQLAEIDVEVAYRSVYKDLRKARLKK
jgi:hypothetical protein